MYVIKLNSTNHTMNVKHVTRTVTLKHVGRRGPQGIQGIQGPPGSDADALVSSVNGEQGDVVLTQDDVLDGTTYKQYSQTEKTKLSGIATGATANSSDATLLARANHTGTQAISTVSGLQAAIDAKEDLANKSTSTSLGSSDTLYPSQNAVKSYVDTQISTVEGSDVDSFNGRTGTVIPATDDYTWAQINKATSNIADITTKSHTSLTDIGTNTHPQIDTHIASTSNPHSVTKTQVGLSNVDNTSDVNKPVSTATQTALNLKQAKATITVGLTGDSGYVTDGTADDVQLNAAIVAVNAAGGGIVDIASPLTLANMITLYPSVTLRSQGDETPISISAGFGAGVVFRENSGAAHYQTILDLTVDLAGKADVGGIHIYQGNFVYLRNVHVKNQTYSSASKWGVRIGNYTSGSPAGTASHGSIIENLRITNCNCGTYEQLLFINQQDARIVNPYFESNTNSLAYELMLYINNKNVVVENPHFETPNAHSIGMMESDGIIINSITANHDDNFKLITIINTANVLIDGVEANSSVATPTNTVVEFFDRTLGPDGFTQIVEDTTNVRFDNINIRGWKHFISCQIGGTVLGTDYTMNQSNIQFNDVVLQSSYSSPFIIGIDNAANNLHDWDFNNVKILSWSGTNVGAYQLRGYSSAVGQMYNFRFREGSVVPSTGGGSYAAVRSIGMTVQLIASMDVTGTFTSYGAFSTATGGVISQIRNHKISTTAPTVSSDVTIGYGPGSRWYDTTNSKEYVCLSGAAGAAVWKLTSLTAGTDYYAPGGTDVAIADGGTGASTAATARTNLGVQSKTFVTVGTADADYITDGTADDVQIQAAIDAVNTDGGGEVILQAGTFNTTSEITLKSNVTIRGMGRGVTKVLCSASTVAWAFDTNTTGTSKTTNENIFLIDFSIGNITASHSSIIRNTTNCGYIRMEAYHTDWSTAIRETLVLQHCKIAYFYDCFIHDSNGNGVQVNACDYFHVRGNTVINFYDNIAQAGTYHMDDGVDIDEDFLDTHTVPSRYGTVEYNTVEGSTNGNNFRIASSQYVYVNNNTSINHDCNAAASILVNSYSDVGHPDTHHIYVQDNQIIGGTDSGIKIQYTSPSLLYDIFVQRNSLDTVGTTAASGQLGAGILIIADGVTITDNYLKNCGKNSVDGGALMIYGSKNNQIIKRNHIIDSPGAAVRFWNGGGASTYTGIILEDTYLSNNLSSYINTSITTFASAKNNTGLNPDIKYDIGNITGATTITRVNGRMQTATLTGNVTLTLTSGVITGDELRLFLTQDATGSRTITWPANAKLAGSSLVLTTTASATDVVTFIWDGTNWREKSRALNRVISIADGGTGASTASAAFTALKQDATTTATGVVELATDAETITGTDTTRGVTPSNITAKIDTDGTLAGNLDTRIPSQKAVKTYADTKQPLDSDLTTIAGLTATTDNFIQAKSSAWASRTVAQVKTDLGLTGTNSGDQTSIVGITGTTAQFNTALTDNDFATLAGTEVLTNKAITPRVVSMADATSITPTGDTADVNTQTNTQAAGTLTANAPSGTPVDEQKLVLRIKSTNAQTWSWNAIYRGSNDVILPTSTTGSSKTDRLGFVYNSADAKWSLVAKSLGY